MRSSLVLALLAALAVPLVGCTADDSLEVGPGDVTKAGTGKTDSSVEAVFVDMEFDASLFATSSFNPRQSIQSQLLYTIGHLNHDRSVGRLDRLTISDVTTTPVGAGFEIKYHARMPVAWGHKDDVPASYAFTLPRDVSFDGLESFTTKYMESCVDFSAHEVTSGSMWYYYRPHGWSCALEPADVIETTATVSLSSINTTGKFPEYDKVWEDDALRVVAIFGKFENGNTTSDDDGIAAYNRFVASMKSLIAPFGGTTTPASIPFDPGVDVSDATFSATLPDGRKLEVVTLLVDNVATPPAWFDPRYAALSTHADIIAYNGHAGLGQNVRALANKGEWTAGQYLIMFMNGCDTYAYVDGSMAQTRAAINLDDPTGTKYMDIVTNAMPAYFHQLSRDSTALIKGLLAVDAPQTYESIFAGFDATQVVLVSGEQDNVFVPGGPTDPVDPTWTGMTQAASLAREQELRFATPTLAAGTYRFTLSGSHDADLYVRIGVEPTVDAFDCRPYLGGSDEVCEVELNAPAVVHAMLRGYSSAPSDVTMVAEKL